MVFVYLNAFLTISQQSVERVALKNAEMHSKASVISYKQPQGRGFEPRLGLNSRGQTVTRFFCIGFFFSIISMCALASEEVLINPLWLGPLGLLKIMRRPLGQLRT